MNGTLLKDLRDGILRLTLNRPAVRNALDEDLITALTAEFRAIDFRSPVRVIVLSGAGERAFCASGRPRAKCTARAATSDTE